MDLTLTRCETDADFQAWRAVRIAVLPYERCPTIAELREQDTVDRLLLVAVRDGQLVGSGMAGRSDSAGVGFVAPRVVPEQRRRGVGSALLTALTSHVAGLGFSEVRATVDDDESLAFAHSHGFADIDHKIEQTRSTAGLPSAPSLPEGVEVVLESERPGLWVECYERFGKEALAGFAVTTALEVSLERWQTVWRGDPLFLALHEGEVIGCAGLFLDEDSPARAENALTAVRRDWRGRELAAHLKLRALAWAAEHEIAEVYTWTQDGNAGMRALNTKLGYATTRRSTKVARSLPPGPPEGEM